MRRHLIVPDTQVKPGVPTEHISWAAQAIVDYKPDVIVHLGDHWDMPSLSSYDKPGGMKLEGARILADIQVGNEAFERLVEPMNKEIARLERGRRKRWKPECHYLRGNHDDRVNRLVRDEALMEGVVSMDSLRVPSPFQTHDFLKIVSIDGIWYSHYFQSSLSAKAIGGSIDNRLNKIGHSFVMGHQQGFLYGCRQFPGDVTRHGLVAGSFYLHDEDYRGAQSNGEWRGIVVLNEVNNGKYDIMPLSMDYLKRKYS